MIKKTDPSELMAAFDQPIADETPPVGDAISHQAAYDFGRAAAMQKQPVTANPYSPTTEANSRYSWDQGYLSFIGEV